MYSTVNPIFQSSRPCKHLYNMTIFWRISYYSDCVYFYWNLPPAYNNLTGGIGYLRAPVRHIPRYIIIITCSHEFMNFQSDPLNLDVGFWNESIRLGSVTNKCCSDAIGCYHIIIIHCIYLNQNILQLIDVSMI